MGVDITLNNVGSGYNRSTINENFEAIETAFQDAVSVTNGGVMQNDLDMNGNDILNISELSVDSLTVDGTTVLSELFSKGDPGEAATITVGTVTTGAPGTSVIVTNAGDAQDAILNFTIPRGDVGASGAGTGDMVGAQNLSDVANAATAFANIKQAASETDTGVVEKATTAEVLAGSDDVRYVSPVGVKAATDALLSTEDLTVTGGARVTSKSLGTISSGTLTLDPGDRPLQHYTNNGAHTLAPGTNAGSFILDITNGASAGAITTSGFTKVVGAFATNNGYKYRCSVSVGNAGSLLSIQAMQ